MRYLWKLTKALVYWCRQTRSCKNTRIQQGRCIKVNMSVNSDTHMALKKPPLWMKLRLLTKQLMGLDLKLLFEIIFGSTKIQTLDDRLRSANTTTVLCPSSLWMKNFFQSDFFQGKFFSELHQIKINQVVCWLPKSWSSAIIWRQDFLWHVTDRWPLSYFLLQRAPFSFKSRDFAEKPTSSRWMLFGSLLGDYNFTWLTIFFSLSLTLAL